MENIPLISKFKKYCPELEHAKEFIFNYYLYTFIHNLTYLKRAHNSILSCKVHLILEPFFIMQSNADNTNGIITISDTCDRLPRNAQVVVILAEFDIIEIPNLYLKDCCQLKYIHMPEDIHTIGDYAFYNCTNLKSIDLPKDSIL